MVRAEKGKPSFVKWIWQKLRGIPNIERPMLQGFIGLLLTVMGPITAAQLYNWMPRLWAIWIPTALLTLLYGLYLMDTALNYDREVSES